MVVPLSPFFVLMKNELLFQAVANITKCLPLTHQLEWACLWEMQLLGCTWNEKRMSQIWKKAELNKILYWCFIYRKSDVASHMLLNPSTTMEPSPCCLFIIVAHHRPVSRRKIWTSLVIFWQHNWERSWKTMLMSSLPGGLFLHLDSYEKEITTTNLHMYLKLQTTCNV